FVHGSVLHVADDANDLDWVLGAVEASGRSKPDALADRVLAGPVPPRGGFVDHGDRRPPRAILVGERSAHARRDPKRAKVIRRHVVAGDCRRARPVVRTIGDHQTRLRATGIYRSATD